MSTNYLADPIEFGVFPLKCNADIDLSQISGKNDFFSVKFKEIPHETQIKLKFHHLQNDELGLSADMAYADASAQQQQVRVYPNGPNQQQPPSVSH